MQKTDDLIQYDVSKIRSILIEYVKSNYPKIINEVNSDKYWLYNYYSSLFYATLIIENDINYYYLRPPSEEGILLLEHVAMATHADTDKVVLDAAMVSWLTIDEFRWSNLRPYLATPKDLHYGLVLKCYSPIVNSAAFLAGLWSQSQFNSCFDHDDHQEAYDFILNCLNSSGLYDPYSALERLCSERLGSHPRLNILDEDIPWGDELP